MYMYLLYDSIPCELSEVLEKLWHLVVYFRTSGILYNYFFRLQNLWHSGLWKFIERTLDIRMDVSNNIFIGFANITVNLNLNSFTRRVSRKQTWCIFREYAHEHVTANRFNNMQNTDRNVFNYCRGKQKGNLFEQKTTVTERGLYEGKLQNLSLIVW